MNISNYYLIEAVSIRLFYCQKKKFVAYLMIMVRSKNTFASLSYVFKKILMFVRHENITIF